MAPRGNAPGSYVYESAQGSSVGAATFNTVYMLVDAPDSASVLKFPYNRPMECGSLDVYENLIGNIPTGGTELISYQGVRAFHQNVNAGDLRVVRVGTPSIIKSLAFVPSRAATVLNNFSKGQTVYVKARINDVELGERNSNNEWLGIPVKLPVAYVSGDHTNNQVISKAVIREINKAIKANGDVNTAVYVRELTDDGFGDGQYGLYLTGRVFNAPTEIAIVNSEDTNTLGVGTFLINDSVTESDQSVYDWIQTVQTSFDDVNLAKGFICAPAAFRVFGQNERVNLGQSMEELARDEDHKWLAMVDCGPYGVTEQNFYKNQQQFEPSEVLKKDDLALVGNTVYKWTDSDSLKFDQAAYTQNAPYLSVNSNKNDEARFSLRNIDRTLYIDNSENVQDNDESDDEDKNTLKLNKDLPIGLNTGDKVTIGQEFGSKSQAFPEYVLNSVTSINDNTPAKKLTGNFYLILSDNLSDRKRVRLAVSKNDAEAGIYVKFKSPGTLSATNSLDITYGVPLWKFNPTIKNKTSSLVEVNNSNGASFNTSHLPASLQKATSKFSFKSHVRQLTDPNSCISRGGEKLFYITKSVIDSGPNKFKIPDHGLKQGDRVDIRRVPLSGKNYGGLLKGESNIGQVYYAEGVDPDSFRLRGLPLGEITDPSSVVKNDKEERAVGILTTGNQALILCVNHGLSTNDVIFFNKPIKFGTDTLLFAGKPYYVESVDKNYFKVAESSSDLSSGNFVNYPLEGTLSSESVQFYKKLEFSEEDSVFQSDKNLSWIRGRKYQIDTAQATKLIKDEANQEIIILKKKPWDTKVYEENLTIEIRLATLPSPKKTEELNFSNSNTTNNTFYVNGNNYRAGDSVKVVSPAKGLLPGGLKENVIYYVIEDSSYNSLKISQTNGGSGLSTTVAGGGGVFIPANTDFDFSYTEDNSAKPLNEGRKIEGENSFFCVPVESSNSNLYVHPCIKKGNEIIPLENAYSQVNYINPTEEVPANLWNFNAVTGEDLINEALRGVNNAGTPQVEIVEKGIDTHQKLNEEALRYNSSQGFLAFYGPYIKNDLGIYMPPSPYVTGMALTRYKDRPNGWILPPAGQRHALNGARGVQIQITTTQQDISNKNGLNALRQLPGYSQRDRDTGEVFGPVYVYGARTRANPANAEQRLYQFINTRVIMNVIYGTMRRALDGEIFNIIEGGGLTYSRISEILYETLHDNFYLTGALYGDSASEAFQVVVDDSNNTDTGLEDGFIGVKAYVVPSPTLERIETDLIRVGIGRIGGS